MLKVYIADDEEIVRQGLKNIIDWEAIGYEICGEAGNGLTAYNDIRTLKPDLIMIDIRMPKLQGLDLANQLREDGFKGHIIVLSGYSEFRYAQEAIRCDVDYYLTKPIEEDELTEAVVNIRGLIQKQQIHSEHMNFYQEKAKDKILEDIIQVEGKSLVTVAYSLTDLNLDADTYQILILQKPEDIDAYADLCQVLKVPVKTTMIEQLSIGTYDVILLKGELIISRFRHFSEQEMDIEKPYFISVGSVVSGINDIYYSYHEALAIYEWRFFLNQRKSIKTAADLPPVNALKFTFDSNDSKEIGRQIYDYIIVFKKHACQEFLLDLKVKLMHSTNSAKSIKSMLAGAYIHIVQEFKGDYASYEPMFLPNAEIIQWFHECTYLQEILDFIGIEVDRLIQLIGGFSSESIVDEIMAFISHHYDENIKLKKLAPKFGYNSSYLGKIFSKKTGISFNDYLHKVRTEKAKELLLNRKYKVYEISAHVGYKNVDYFHLKFKRFEGCTPNEYRIANHIQVE